MKNVPRAQTTVYAALSCSLVVEFLLKTTPARGGNRQPNKNLGEGQLSSW